MLQNGCEVTDGGFKTSSTFLRLHGSTRSHDHRGFAIITNYYFTNVKIKFNLFWVKLNTCFYKLVKQVVLNVVVDCVLFFSAICFCVVHCSSFRGSWWWVVGCLQKSCIQTVFMWISAQHHKCVTSSCLLVDSGEILKTQQLHKASVFNSGFNRTPHRQYHHMYTVIQTPSAHW